MRAGAKAGGLGVGVRAAGVRGVVRAIQHDARRGTVCNRGAGHHRAGFVGREAAVVGDTNMLFETEEERRRREWREFAEFWVGPLDEELGFAQRLAHFTMRAISCYAGIWIAIWLTQIGLGPRGWPSGDFGMGGLFIAFIWLIVYGLWWGLLFSVGSGFTWYLLDRLVTRRERLIAYLIVLLVAPLPALITWHLRPAPAPTVDSTVEVATPLHDPDAKARDAAFMARFPRLRTLLAERESRWRADVAAAGAHGPPGEIPRWLEVWYPPR